VVTPTGCNVITRFPAEDLPIANFAGASEPLRGSLPSAVAVP
jgi:hypothetical protein